MKENPRINRQERQKITLHGSFMFHGSRRFPNSALLLHTEAVHLVVFQPCLRPLKACGGSPSLLSAICHQHLHLC